MAPHCSGLKELRTAIFLPDIREHRTISDWSLQLPLGVINSLKLGKIATILHKTFIFKYIFKKKYVHVFWFKLHWSVFPKIQEPVFGQVNIWWRHQMEPFSALLAICAGNSPVTGEFPSQRPVIRSFDVVFDLRLNKRLSKQPRRRWFETPSHSLWRHCNDLEKPSHKSMLTEFTDVYIEHRTCMCQGLLHTGLANTVNFLWR